MLANRGVSSARALIEGGANINDRGRDGSTVLLEATRQGNRPFVELLVNLGADPKDPRLVHTAIRADYNDLLGYFLAKGASPDARLSRSPLPGRTVSALVLAVAQKNVEAVRILLDAGAHPDGPDGRTKGVALDLAQRDGLTEIEGLLKKAASKQASAPAQ